MSAISIDAENVPSHSKATTVSIGIFAHNEEATIRTVLDGFLGQRVSCVVIESIIVVCCGCTDQTLPLVSTVMREQQRVEMVIRQKREGKIAAINAFLETADTDVLILASADVVPAPDLVERLALPLTEEPSVAMTGPRIVTWPAVIPRRVVDNVHNVLWNLHHVISLRSPKLGEIVAVRRIALPGSLPDEAHCDEALLESIVVERGGKLGYVPSALAYNLPPRSLGEFYLQRRRIAAQHVLLRRARGYRPATTEPRFVVEALWRSLSGPLRTRSHVLLLCVLQGTACLHGRWDVLRGRDYRLWRVTRRRPFPDDCPPRRASDRLPRVSAIAGGMTGTRR
jgi:cellulose synthase/poly-beta-1,6-N-acetylglucosamine synthase-like glycosyltransferase